MTPERVDVRTLLPGLLGTRIHVVRSAEETTLRDALDSEAFAILTIAGSAVTNEATFFDEVTRVLELPEWFGRNWDALVDAVAGLAERPERRLALLWVDADQSLAADLSTFLQAVIALDGAAEGLGADEPPHQLEVFLLGSGAGFPAVT